MKAIFELDNITETKEFNIKKLQVLSSTLADKFYLAEIIKCKENEWKKWKVVFC